MKDLFMTNINAVGVVFKNAGVPFCNFLKVAIVGVVSRIYD